MMGVPSLASQLLSKVELIKVEIVWSGKLIILEKNFKGINAPEIQ